MKLLIVPLRIILALVALIGLGLSLWTTVTHGDSVIDFFSYFTTIGTTFACIVLIYSAVKLMRGQRFRRRDDFLRAMALIYMLLIGGVYFFLLRNTPLGNDARWVTTVHHYILPLALLADWIIQPPAGKITLRSTWLALVVPLAYLVYSLVRGTLTGFYPYDFFNPAKQGGYAGVAIYCLAMLVGFLLLSLGVRWLGNILVRRRLDVKRSA